MACTLDCLRLQGNIGCRVTLKLGTGIAIWEQACGSADSQLTVFVPHSMLMTCCAGLEPA